MCRIPISPLRKAFQHEENYESLVSHPLHRRGKCVDEVLQTPCGTGSTTEYGYLVRTGWVKGEQKLLISVLI